MKTFASRIGLALGFAGVLGFTAMASDVVIKKGGMNFGRAPKSQFATPKPAAPAEITCTLCKPEVGWTTTQDTKLKTKKIPIEKHACGSCGTSVKTVGPKGATKTVVDHTCAGKVANVASCCASVPGMK